MPSTTTPNQSPALDLAHSIGTNCALEWINRTEQSTIPAASAAYRAICYAYAVNDYQDAPEFLPLLEAWCRGFDSELISASGKPVTPEQEYIGSYGMSGGDIRVSIKRGHAHDHADMRVAQLSALLNLTYGGGGEWFRNSGSTIQDNVLWLASSLTDELGQLLQLVAADARKDGAA